jgi:hypothetical protein
MASQGNRVNGDSYAGILVVGEIADGNKDNHSIEEEIGPNYTGEDRDERGPGRDNGMQNSQGAAGTTGTGDDGGDGPSGLGENNDDDFYSSPSMYIS